MIVILRDFNSHLQRLEKVLKRLQDAGLKLKPTKWERLQDEVHYLGYVVSAKSVATDAAKPLTQLVSGDNACIWSAEKQMAFQRLKDGIVSAQLLRYPDPKLQYILDTAASAVGVGAVLSQIQEGKERVIAYYSKTLAPSEFNYCVTQ